MGKQDNLDELPDLPLVEKECAAVAESDGLQIMRHIPNKLVTRWEKIFAICGNEQGWYTMQLAKACASLGKPGVLQRELGHLGLSGLLRETQIQAFSLPTLLEKHHVRSIGTLNLDTEGYDC